jgi:DNA-binding transcriptional LysR family regulator
VKICNSTRYPMSRHWWCCQRGSRRRVRQGVKLRQLRHEPLILTPRGQTWFDMVTATCRQAGFEPVLGQPGPQMGSVVNPIAAELGYSLVPASLSQV